jgi:hypothetical protein
MGFVRSPDWRFPKAGKAPTGRPLAPAAACYFLDRPGVDFE